MEKEKIINLQIIILIALIALVVSFIATFPKILEVGSGITLVGDNSQKNIDFGVIHLVNWALIIFLLYLILISFFLYFDKNNILFTITQVVYWIGFIFITIFIIFFLKDFALSFYNPYDDLFR